MPFTANELYAKLPKTLPSSEYHGDFTLENILYSLKDDFVLIDPLTTEYDSYVFDLAKLRYHKVIPMADADVDGQHIRTLLLTLLFRFMRPLIEGGFVYLAQPPLYKIKWGGKEPVQYAFSDKERDGFIKIGTDAGKRLPKEDGIQRFKGLGEMPAKELWDTTMDPNNRVLIRVTLEDAAAADDLFSVLMGEDVEQRRQFIQRNAKDVRFLDI